MEEDDEIGLCGKCGTMQLVEECKETVIAQLRVKDTNGERLCLRAFDDTVLKKQRQT